MEGIKITHPERVVYPEDGYTKQDVADYYEMMADYIMPHIKGRPLSIIRCPDGLRSKCFFQRHLEGAAAKHIKQLPIKDQKSGAPYFSADTKKALISLIQFGVIEIHTWGSQAPHFRKPNIIVIDLDPDPKIDWPSVKEATLLVKRRLEKLKLKTFLKATGGKGLHVVAPIAPKKDWVDVKDFCRAFVEELAADYPDAFTINPRKDMRRGKIFLDYLRNEYTSTSIMPFSLRARPGAPVALPLDWKDLKSLKSSDAFTMKSVMAKVGKGYKDPWQGKLKSTNAVPDIKKQ